MVVVVVKPILCLRKYPTEPIPVTCSWYVSAAVQCPVRADQARPHHRHRTLLKEEQVKSKVVTCAAVPGPGPVASVQWSWCRGHTLLG